MLFTLAVLVAGWLLVAGLAPLPLLGTEAVKAALRHRAFQPLVGRLSRS